MWMVYAILTFFLWGIADLFYKKGNNDKDKYSHLKTGIMVGLVMGIHAIIYYFVKGVKFDFMSMLKYLPVSLCYIISMIIGYKGLKYINLSISSPIQNSSGLITSLLLVIIFKVKLSIWEVLALIVMAIGVIMLSVIENKKDLKVAFKKITVAAILFPLLYCVIDGAGTFLDSIYLDMKEIIDEDMALIAYEFTFFIYGLLSFIYLKFKKVKMRVKDEKARLSAAIFETLGQFTYVFAISSHSVITAPIVACYSALSVLLSRIFLKEKISKLQYLALFLIFASIIMLAILEEI
ncbi:MAG: EamA family transporter [Bacilli bacterium]|nr:EamA family transporter [Bacilli bacterium]